jgi:hypothetical protein
MAVTQESTEPTQVRTRNRGWRRVVVALLLVVATVLAPLALIALWTRSQVVNTDRFVAQVGPLTQNPAVAGLVADRLSQALATRVDLQAEIRDALPDRAKALAAPIAQGVISYTRDAAYKVVTSDQFHNLWVAMNRTAHSQVRTLLEGGKGPLQAKNGKVVLDLHDLAVAVVARVKAAGVDAFDKIPVDKLGGTIEIIDSDGLAKAQRATRLVDRGAMALAVLVLVLYAGAVAVSRTRRRTLLKAGFALAMSMALLAALLALGRSVYLDTASAHLPEDAAAALFDAVAQFLRQGLRTLLVLGVLVAAGAWLVGPSSLAVRIRGGASSGLGGVGGSDFGDFGDWVSRHKPALRVAGLGLAVVALVFWSTPTPGTVLLIAVLLLVWLGAVELFGRPLERVPGPAKPA